jgi:phytanoyl-CoA hydroxylase
MASAGSLTAQDQAQYKEQGFVVIRGLYDSDLLHDLDERFADLAVGGAERPAEMKVMKDIMVVKGAVDPETPLHAINKMISFEDDEQMYRYVMHPPLLAAVRYLVGEQIYSVSTNVFNKPPGVDGRHPFHQDLRYFRIRPADAIIGTWTAIYPATRASGCLAVLPGTHKGLLHDHGDPDWEFVNKGFYAIDDVDVDARVHVELEPGDTLLFHPLLIHGSGHNRSKHFRRAISAHFAGAQATSDTRDWTDGKQVRLIPG